MKKVISLLLVLACCLSLCGCGGNTDTSNEKLLIENEWRGLLDFTIDGQRIVKFEKNSTGSFVYPEANNKKEEFTWSMNGNTVNITVKSTDPMGGEYITENAYEYIKNENTVQLKSTTGFPIFVLTDNLESETNAIKQKMLGEAIELDWKTASSVKLSNEVKFKTEYVGKTYKYTAKVYEISSRYCEVANETYMGLPSNSIRVFMDTKELGQISELSTITVVGTLSSSGSLAHAFLVED